MSSDYDVTLDTYKFRFRRDVENAYEETVRRVVIQDQEIPTPGSQQASQIVTDRGDYHTVLQSDWSGGSRWEKPILGVSDVSSYFDGLGMDPFSKPGKLVPANQLNEDSASAWVDSGMNLVQAGGEAFSLDSGAVYRHPLDTQVGVVDPSNSSVLLDTVFTHVDTGQDKFMSMGTDGSITRWATNASFTAIVTADPVAGSGLGIFEGNVIVYDRDGIHEVDEAGSALTLLTDDGEGDDWLEANLGTATDVMVSERYMRLMVADGTGIYYVKNVIAPGPAQARLYRVDRTQAGTYVRRPIATLPPGNIVLNIAKHLGSIMLLSSPDIPLLIDNDNSGETIFARTDLWSVTANNLAPIGRVQNEDTLDDTISQILGSHGDNLYLGGMRNIYVYDAARGGVHRVWKTTDVGIEDGQWAKMVPNDRLYFHHFEPFWGEVEIFPTIDYQTVGSLGTDYDMHYIISNPFNFRNPLDTARIEYVDIELEDEAAATERWSLFLRKDEDTAWTLVAAMDNGDGKYKSVQLNSSDFEGRTFQYKIAYETTSATTEATPLMQVAFRATVGSMVTTWSLQLDGSEIYGPDNEIVNPADVEEDMRALAATRNPFNAVFRFEEFDRDTTRTVRVKAEAWRAIRNTPSEGNYEIALVEA